MLRSPKIAVIKVLILGANNLARLGGKDCKVQ